MKVFARVPGLAILAALLLVGPASAPAASPPSGTIEPSNTSAAWTGGPYVLPQPLPDVCPPASDPANVRCDHFYLTVNVSPSYWDANHGGAQIQITWASPNDDFDLYVYDNGGNLVGQSASGGTTSERVPAPEREQRPEPVRGPGRPFLTVAATYNGTRHLRLAAGRGANRLVAPAGSRSRLRRP